jgi:hypothetical protein
LIDSNSPEAAASFQQSLKQKVTNDGIIANAIANDKSQAVSTRVQAEAKAVADKMNSGNEKKVSPEPVKTELPAEQPDQRARLRPYAGTSSKVYVGIMKVLETTNGMLFPYTPSITHTPATEYSKYSLIHANTEYQAFSKNTAQNLSVKGTFTSQTPDQARYTLACIHFLKTITKMRFGSTDEKRGMPPPLLLFDAYGFFMFNQLPVILKKFDVNFEGGVDYVPVDASGGSISDLNSDSLTWVPSKLDISIEMVVQQQPRAWRKDFDFDGFRSGKLMLKNDGVTKRSGGWL